MKHSNKKKFKKSHKQRWKPYFNEKREAEEYHKLLSNSLHPIQETSLTKAGSVILKCANECDTSHMNAANFEKPWQNKELKKLIAQRRECRDNEQRKLLSKQIFKLTRKLKCKWKIDQASHILEEVHKFESNP